MSANITQNMGGFRAPDNSALAPSLIDASAGSFHSNNPYRQPSPTPGPANEQYPSYAPPSYEQVASATHSPAPPVTDSKHEQGPRDLGGYGGQHPVGPSTSLASPQMSERAQPTVPASGSSDMMDKIMGKINPRDPLDPPPPCFSRAVPAPSPETTYQTLSQPLVIHSKPGQEFLEDGFATTGTPPLHKHDIWAEDWVRLLEDIHIVARLTTGQKIQASVLPKVLSVGGIAGFFVGRAIKGNMKRKNTENVTQLLQIWNERFFKPRHLEITLCRGDYRVVDSSSNKVRLPAADRPHAHPRPVTHSDSSSDSSSSSSDSEHESMRMSSGRGRGRIMRGRGAGRSERRAERQERRSERREERQERREERRERKARRREERRSKEPYRLVVVSV